MVETAVLVPERVVEDVAEEHGEASIAAVREAYSEEELQHFQRECIENPEMEVVVFAALDSIEHERVVEAAEEAGQPAAEWLMEATREVTLSDPAPIGHMSIEHMVEDAIVRRA